MSKDGHVNLSPKGYDTFRILSDRKVAYLDLTGSGNETSSHLEENGRITMMFCAFQGPPNILRLYGTGTVILPEDNEWERYTECSSRAWSPADHYGRYTQSPDVLRLCGSIHVVRERARRSSGGRSKRRRRLAQLLAGKELERPRRIADVSWETYKEIAVGISRLDDGIRVT